MSNTDLARRLMATGRVTWNGALVVTDGNGWRSVEMGLCAWHSARDEPLVVGIVAAFEAPP